MAWKDRHAAARDVAHMFFVVLVAVLATLAANEPDGGPMAVLLSVLVVSGLVGAAREWPSDMPHDTEGGA